MGALLATVTLPHVSGFVDEDFVNTFAFLTSDLVTPTVAAGEIAGILPGFYNTDGAAAVAIADYISPGVSRVVNACKIRVYNIAGHLDGSPHGSPLLTSSFTMGPGSLSAQALPEEIALACTLRGQGYQVQPVEIADGSDPDSAVDRPKQRVTGKLYIGPFNMGAPLTVASKARPAVNLVPTILDAAERLYDEADVFFHAWGVWSRKNAEITPLEAVQVDDAFDVQRRRGVRPTTRTTRVVEP